MSNYSNFPLSLADRSRFPSQDGASNATIVTRPPQAATNVAVVVPDPGQIIIISDDSDSPSRSTSRRASAEIEATIAAAPTVAPIAAPTAAPRASRFDASLAQTSNFYTANPRKRVRGANTEELAALGIKKPKPKRVRLKGTEASLDLINEVDDAQLPRNFTFVDEYVFREGTKRLDPEFRSGCTCGQQNGRNIGCEYVQKCECLEDAAKSHGKVIGFPYHGIERKKGCLQNKYLQTRWAIYECSSLCNCGPRCRNKLVQHGRKIPLEIFRTKERGWGLRSPQKIQQGQFIDTYRGEVITDAEADRREEESSGNKDSYLFTLDKFGDIIDDPSALYVVDGEFMGGPTRFINHSCDPNCAIFSVSTTRGDAKVYDLAFFALEEIPAGEELTFDYVGDDDDKVPDDDEIISSQTANSKKLATKCLCKSDNCRGYLWI